MATSSTSPNAIAVGQRTFAGPRLVARANLVVSTALALLLGPLAIAARSAELLGVAKLPGTLSDKSNLHEVLQGGIPHDRLGGYGSAIAYSGQGSRYWLLADRGPLDGAVPYRCRVHQFDIVVSPGAQVPVQARLVSTTLLSDDRGRKLVGYSGAISGKDAVRFDPEGLVCTRLGRFVISDEYGPTIRGFDDHGKQLRELPVPSAFQVAQPAADAAEERSQNTRGRVPNGGFEGLAYEGGKLYACLQCPLIQDGGEGELLVRMLEHDVRSGTQRQFVYRLDGPKYAISEIAAFGPGELLVLERDKKAGRKAKFKRLFAVNVAGARDVSGVTSLNSAGDPPAAMPKRLLIDLLGPRFGLAGKDFPAKIEGLAFGPNLPDGRRLLLVTSDNDVNADEPTWIMAFAIDGRELHVATAAAHLR